MKIYRYWAVEKRKITVQGEEKEINCYGGSNISEQDAHEKALERIQKIENRISGDKHAFDGYEVEIREEIIREIDSKTIITRNRYGAQVLNIQDQMIMDIDKPKTSFLDIFKKPQEDKTKIIEMLHTLSKKPNYREYGYRIYETFKGIRVIVLGKAFDASAWSTQMMMQEFNCDPLYRTLCSKQKCFRARLTPKPFRIKLPRYKVQYPRNSAEETKLQKWLITYEAIGQNYNVCKFVEQIGAADLPEAVQLHDEMTGAYSDQSLA